MSFRFQTKLQHSLEDCHVIRLSDSSLEDIRMSSPFATAPTPFLQGKRTPSAPNYDFMKPSIHKDTHEKAPHTITS